MKKQNYQRLGTVLVIVLVFRIYLKLRKKIRKWKRAKEIALRLPTGKRPKELKYSLDLQGMIIRKMPIFINV